jgi:hypothetical protein
MRCPVCPVTHVANSIFCDECGSYLLKEKELGTDPFDMTQLRWLGGVNGSHSRDTNLPNTRPLSIRLHIGCGVGKDNQARELHISLEKPIRLGRIDPPHHIFPEVDLTDDLGRERGVSREHTCIFQQGNTVKMEDLGSTNGTLLNGERLDPYIPELLRWRPVSDGQVTDQSQH